MKPESTTAIRELLSHLIDYAGLFPPAALGMLPAIDRYAEHLRGPESWLLGRFVVPVSRLEEFGQTMASSPHLIAGSTGGWKLSAILGSSIGSDLARVVSFNEAHASSPFPLIADSVELKANSPDDIAPAIDIIPSSIRAYVEIPISADPAALIQAIKSAGACAKVRTGGTSEDVFPSSHDLVQFLRLCVSNGVPFKATAGLHHALRGGYPLTYEKNSATGTMFGFLNVFLTAAFLSAGMSVDDATGLIEEPSIATLRFGRDFITWRGWSVSGSEIAVLRKNLAGSFGSCSFHEPAGELKSLGLL